MQNIRLVIEYDGTDFCGYQRQSAVRTVQGELETALQQLTKTPISVSAAGRTDAGVHAMGQVINFHVAESYPINAFLYGLNPLLPDDIRVLAADRVADDFHARYDAVDRHYRYVIVSKVKAIGRHYAWFNGTPLDIVGMQVASEMLQGEHDFKSFCQSGVDARHYLCDVTAAEWHKESDRVVFDIIANRFLHNMVRILVGTLVDVGSGRLTVDDFSDIFEKRDRRSASATAPAKGLVLVEVSYREPRKKPRTETGVRMLFQDRKD
jgi:tRNA pseudouridine38-40 synthase